MINGNSTFNLNSNTSIMKYFYSWTILILLSFSIFSSCKIVAQKLPELAVSKEAKQDERSNQIDEWLIKISNEYKFNGAVLMIKNGETLIKNAYGFTDAEKNVPLSNLSSFRLASVSKQFTAAGIMILHEQGKLSFDHAVSDYIEGFPYEGVSIRHLLNHTSGIPDNYLFLAYKNANKIDILSTTKAVELVIEANKKAKSKPNESFNYNNTNYILLAKIVENVSGSSFEDFMMNHLFKPLGLQQTRVWNLLSKDKTFEHKTASFKNNGPNPKPMKPDLVDGVAGDGAVFSSIEDMIKWDQFWYENELISETTMLEAFKKPLLNDGSYSNYGFGWGIKKDGVAHNGSWLGARTIIVRNTEEKNCLVILDNSKNPLINDIAKILTKNF